MENVPTIMKRAITTLPQTLPQVSSEATEISLYSGELTPACVATEIKKLKAAFPSLQAEFYNILGERIAANNFSDDRLRAAIGNLLDNFRFETPRIADIIGFDRKVKLYSYYDVCNHVTDGGSFKDFTKIYRQEYKKPFWIKTTEKIKYNIPDKL